MCRLIERWPQPLTRHLQQAEARDASDLDARAIHFHRISQPVFDIALVLRRCHIDEIDDNQTADVAQAQLPGDFVCGLEIGIQRGGFDVAAFGGTRRVDIDRDQCLGVIDDDGTARGQRDRMRKRRFNLTFDLVAREQRHRVIVVVLELAQVVRHDPFHELLGLFVDGQVVDEDFADVIGEVIAQRPQDCLAFLVDQKRRRARDHDLLDSFPDR